MAVNVESKCWILALFIRDDGERLLLGDGAFDFKEKQQHFTANAIVNDTVDVQGNDGVLIAGQVRRASTQSFDGYVGDATMTKQQVEAHRRSFIKFFAKNHFYKVIYVLPDGSAVKRQRGFIVDAPEVKELWQIHPEYHVALNFEDVNYYNYSEDLDGDEIYGQKITINTSDVDSGGLVWDEYGAVVLDGGSKSKTVSGTTISITDAVAKAPIDIKLYGQTEQDSYSGKNLLRLDNSTWLGSNGVVTSNGITATLNSDVSVSWSGTPTTTWAMFTTDFDCNLPAGTYTLSISKSVAGAGVCVHPTYSDGSSGGDRSISAGNTSVTFTTTATASKIRLALVSLTANTTISADNLFIQLEKGSTATSYEPYVGGTSSPNPNYPQSVETVAGEQTVTITNGEDIKSATVNLRSRNAFNGIYRIYGYSNGVPTSAATGIEINSSSTNSVNFTQTAAVYTFVLSDIIQLKPNTQYVLSFKRTDNPAGSSSRQWVYNYANGVYTNATNSPVVGTGEITFNFTTGGTGEVAIAWGKNNSASNVGSVVDITEIQLEEGETASEFDPYYDYELCKIGSYRDYIYKSGSEWFIHKETAKKVFSASDTWVENTCSDGKRFRTDSLTNLVPAPNISTIIPMFCPILKAGTAGNTWDAVQCISADTIANRVWVYITDTKNYTVANFTKFMAGISVYYPLTTPTDTKITEETLIEELNALATTSLYAGDNTITTETINLKPELRLTYEEASDSIGGFVWDEGGGSSITTVTVDSIDNVYPIITITGEAVNPEIDNLTTGVSIRYNGSISEGQTLVIDTNAQTAKLNGVNVVANLSGNWILLTPGVNRMSYTADNPDAPEATLEWSEVVG